ncbi:MAG: MerR family transcriptional regulator [Polyangiaceae bacterium]
MSTVRLPLFADAPSTPEFDSGERPIVSAGDTLMQVGDLARETGKTVRAIHLYEELELLKPVARSKGRYRLYDSESLVRIRWIGKMQDMGFSLTDIQTVVRDWEEAGSAPSTMVKMREVFKKKIEETRAHMQRLRALEHELEASLDYLDTCDTCEPHRLLSACTVCSHHECTEVVPELVAGFHANGKASAPAETAPLKE